MTYHSIYYKIFIHIIYYHNIEVERIGECLWNAADRVRKLGIDPESDAQ
jgi:hypothetical protein